MDSLRFLIQLDYSQDLHPDDIDEVINKVSSVIDSAASAEELDAESANLEDFDVRFELFDD